jgi:hypothetical protein
MFVRLSTALAALCLLSAPVFAQGGAKPTDPQIAHIAYTAGQLDIEAAKQALAKSKNKEVRDFADQMVRDHTEVNKQALQPARRAPSSDGDDSDKSVFLEHSYKKTRSGPRAFDGRDTQWIAFSISGISLEVRDMNDFLCTHDSTKTSVWAWMYRSAIPELAVGWRSIMQIRRPKTLSIIEREVAELGLTDAHGIREHALKYQFSGRT